MQKRTSKNTSVNSKKLPAIFHKISWNYVTSVLDFGCGKYPEIAKDWLKKSYPHVEYKYYDPYQKIGKAEKAQIAILSNVINVIDNDDAVCETVDRCLRLAEEVGITVYEGDKSGIGK